MISYLSYGGFMGGWAAISVGPLTSNFKGPTEIRDGEYGGPLVLFDDDMRNVLVISSLNNFMVSSIVHDDQVSYIFCNSLQFAFETLDRKRNS